MVDRMLASGGHSVVWTRPPAHLTLSAEEVHVWRANIRLRDAYIQALRNILSDAEQVRVERFYFNKDRDRFAAARGLLRIILSKYLHAPPHLLQFSYGSHGKPSLAAEYSGRGICFNVSHSRDVALYAIAQNRNVGVDIEYVKPRLFSKEIAERFFSDTEMQWLSHLPQEEQSAAFCECWTKTEAYLKARGDGLGRPIERPIMSGISDSSLTEPSMVITAEDNQQWFLWQLVPAPDYKGALVVEGERRNLQCFEFPVEI